MPFNLRELIARLRRKPLKGEATIFEMEHVVDGEGVVHIKTLLVELLPDKNVRVTTGFRRGKPVVSVRYTDKSKS